jgi:hypothetical protein
MSVRRNVAARRPRAVLPRLPQARTSGECPPAMVDAERLEEYVEQLVRTNSTAAPGPGTATTPPTSSTPPSRGATPPAPTSKRSAPTRRAAAARRATGSTWVEPYVAALEAAEREVAQLAAESR